MGTPQAAHLEASAFALYRPPPLPWACHCTVDGESAFPARGQCGPSRPGQGPDPGPHCEWTAAPGPPKPRGPCSRVWSVSWEALASSDCRLPVLVKKNTPRLVWWGCPAPLAGPEPGQTPEAENPGPVGCCRKSPVEVSDSVGPVGPLTASLQPGPRGSGHPPRDCRGPLTPDDCFPATSLVGKALASVGPSGLASGCPGGGLWCPGRGWPACLDLGLDPCPACSGGPAKTPCTLKPHWGPVTLGKKEAGTWSPRSPGRGRRGGLSFQPQAPTCAGVHPWEGRVGTPALK